MRRKTCKTSILANTFGPLVSALQTILKLRHHMICTEENFLDCLQLVSLNLCICHRSEMLTYSLIGGQLILLQRRIDTPYPYLQGTVQIMLCATYDIINYFSSSSLLNFVCSYDPAGILPYNHLIFQVPQSIICLSIL